MTCHCLPMVQTTLHICKKGNCKKYLLLLEHLDFFLDFINTLSFSISELIATSTLMEGAIMGGTLPTFISSRTDAPSLEKRILSNHIFFSLCRKSSRGMGFPVSDFSYFILKRTRRTK